MVYDPTAWVEGTPLNKYEFGDLTIATADIKCPNTGIIMIFKGTHAKIDSGAWNPTLNAHIYDVTANGRQYRNLAREEDLKLVQRPPSRR